MSLLSLHVAQVEKPFTIRPKGAKLVVQNDAGYVHIDPADRKETRSNAERSLAVRRIYLGHYYPGITAKELAARAGRPYCHTVNWLRNHHVHKVASPGKDIQWWLPDEWLDDVVQGKA